MKTSNPLLGAAAALGFAISGQLFAAVGIDHSDRPSCYLSVHSQCYLESDTPCSDDDYQWGLSQCDSSYPGQTARPPAKPLGLKANSGGKRIDMQFRQKIRSSFR